MSLVLLRFGDPAFTGEERTVAQISTADTLSATTREQAEQVVGHAEDSCHDIIMAWRQAVTDFETKLASAQHDATQIGLTAVRCVETNVGLAFEFARKALWAWDLDEIMKLETQFVRAQSKALVEQTEELGRIVAKAAIQFAKS
jgi:hypothetical protein